MKRIQGFLLFLFVAGCVEPCDFAIKNNEPTLVVEAYLSDKSFTETVNYPSDGRYFTVKLTTTTDVTNVRPLPVRGAHVQLLNDDSEAWAYGESSVQPGSYYLVDDDFKAKFGVNYKLSIKLPDESAYESDWETLPTASVPAMGQISFREENIQEYIVESNEEVLVSVKGMWTEVAIPENTTGEPLYYRWTYKPHWIFIAPLASVIDPGHTCWATNPLSVQNYALQTDRTGNYDKELFFMETVRNAKIFVRYSSLIIHMQ